MQTTYLDEALAGFSGYLAIDEVYDGSVNAAAAAMGLITASSAAWLSAFWNRTPTRTTCALS